MKNLLKLALVMTLCAALLLTACSKRTVKEEKKDDKKDKEVVELIELDLPFEYSTSGDTARVKLYTGDETEVIIPATIEDPNTGEVFTIDEIDDGAFFGNDDIVSVELPEGIVTLGLAAFQNCTSLEKVVLPTTLEAIGTRAFFNCPALTDINIGENVSQLGDMVFGEYFTSCPWYANQTQGAVIIGDGILLKYNDCGITSFDETVKHVAYNAFLESTTPKVTFSSALESIHETAFTSSATTAVLDEASEATKDAKMYRINHELYVAEVEPEADTEGEAQGDTASEADAE